MYGPRARRLAALFPLLNATSSIATHNNQQSTINQYQKVISEVVEQCDVSEHRVEQLQMTIKGLGAAVGACDKVNAVHACVFWACACIWLLLLWAAGWAARLGC